MAEDQKSATGKGLVGAMAKKALAPVVHSVVAAGTAYLTRKAIQLWHDKLQPKLEEKGGGGAVARETLETAADKVRGPAAETAEKITALAEKVTGEGSADSSRSSDQSREAERRRREKRRNERRRALEQSGSS
jgi:hypothetical protein